MTRARRREQFMSVIKSVRKRFDYLTPDLVTTWTSRSADRGAQVLRLGVVVPRQTLDTGEHRCGQSPAPTSMHGRESTSDRIAEQNRNAIRRLAAREHAFRVTDYHVAKDGVAVFVLSRLRFVLRLDHSHVGAVNLPATGKRPVARKKLEKPATILQNVLRRVVVKTGEAQRAAWHRADAAETRREAVNKTVLFEWGADESAYAVHLAPVKTCFV